MQLTVNQESGQALVIAERRNAERREIRLPVTILLPVREHSGSPRSERVSLEGWTRNISETGVRFECGVEFDDPRVLLVCELPESGATCVEAQIFNARPIETAAGETAWEYGAIFRKRLQ